jgi:uncharacterized membrane protein HdeD (DUF308 family)
VTSTAAKMEKSTMPWWLVLMEGIALLILGFYFISSPAETAKFVTTVLGIYWLIEGIFRIIGMFMDTSMWGLKLFSGLLGIAAGVIVLNHPFISPLVVGATLVIILGVQGIIMGVVGIIAAFKGGGWGAAILGVISLLFGIFLLTNLWVFTFSLPWAIGLLAIVGGIVAIVAAFKMR